MTDPATHPASRPWLPSWRRAGTWLAVLVLSGASAVGAAPADTARTAAWFDAHHTRPPLLRQFLQRMPKGADLHSHLSGAVYAETYLQWAADDGLCADTVALVFLDRGQACDAKDPRRLPARSLAEPRYSAAWNALVDKLSMRHLSLGGRPGHDQFFDAFGVFPNVIVSPARVAAAAAEVADRAAQQSTLHLELMQTVQSSAVRALGAQQPWDDEPDFARRLQGLREQGLPALVAAGRADLDAIDAALRAQQACGTPTARAGCAVTLRWLQQSTRTGPPEQVFAQLAYAFALAEADARVVGINLVAPEDHPVALRDYSLHMRMVGWLAQQHPGVGVALHAGELAPDLVPPQHLRSHIREAVEVAGARRIGHAVDIGQEEGAAATMATMAARGVAAEVCLTSNDAILGIRGRDHPLADYLAAGVPVVLASDDEGISRIDLSHEYLRAALDQGLGYRQLKAISRASLAASFLPGPSLWQDAARARPVQACRADVPGARTTSARCQAFLDGSERATRQWALEQALDAFERLPDWRALPRKMN